MVSSETKKKLWKQKGKQRRSYDSSDSDFSSDEESWRSGMSGAEQMYMLVSAGINPNDSDIKFDSADEKRYQKQAKKWSKSKGKRSRRWEPEARPDRQAPSKATPVIIDTFNGILHPIKSTQW